MYWAWKKQSDYTYQKQKRLCCIYAIKNSDNNKIYIGSSKSFYKRLNKHINNLRKNIHSNNHLQNAFNKYGENIFEVYILKECKKEQLLMLEQKAINDFKTLNKKYGYNIRPDTTGKNVSEETKYKLKKARKKQFPTFKGKKHSKETKKKISESKKGSIPWNKGKKLSKKHIDKLKSSHKGQIIKEETKLKISQKLKGRTSPNKGKKLSQKTIDKMILTRNSIKYKNKMKKYWNKK